MQQRPGLIIEMTPQWLSEAGEAGSAVGAVSAECSARGSEWRGHEAAWPHRFAKKWRFEGHQFTKHHAPSLYTINRPEKFRSPGHIIYLGSVTMLNVLSCFISCFTSLCKLCRSRFRHCWNGKTRTAVGFPTTWGLGKSWLQDTASSRNLFTTHKSINVAAICCPLLNKLIFQQFVS